MTKPGQAKPFSYGIDLDELKLKTQRRAPPVAPKKKKPVNTGQGQMSAPSGPGTAAYAPTQYNSPDMYSNDNVSSGVSTGMSPKPQKDISDSAVYKMIHENDNRKAQDTTQGEAEGRIQMGSNPNKQSKSFKVLQWMTDTEKADEGPAVEEKPRRQRNPLLRHNSEDDEMRFSGLNNNNRDIPSRSFQKIYKHTAKNGMGGQGSNAVDQSEEPEQVGNYDETSIRYKGKHIPSPSFRVLKSWAELDTPVEKITSRSQKIEEEDDGLPETLNPDEIKDVRYMGGHIPSRVFKSLQKAVGDDTPEVPEPKQNNPEPAKTKIKVISPPQILQTTTTGHNAATDF